MSSIWRKRCGSQAAISSGQRVAVPGRPALQDVRDEHVGARQPDPAEELVEELARLADERDALLVLVEPGRLADEHEVGVRASRAEHDLRTSLRERAARARGGLLRVLSKRGGALDGVHRSASLRRRADGVRAPRTWRGAALEPACRSTRDGRGCRALRVPSPDRVLRSTRGSQPSKRSPASHATVIPTATPSICSQPNT